MTAGCNGTQVSANIRKSFDVLHSTKQNMDSLFYSPLGTAYFAADGIRSIYDVTVKNSGNVPVIQLRIRILPFSLLYIILYWFDWSSEINSTNGTYITNEVNLTKLYEDDTLYSVPIGKQLDVDER